MVLKTGSNSATLYKFMQKEIALQITPFLQIMDSVTKTGELNNGTWQGKVVLLHSA